MKEDGPRSAVRKRVVQTATIISREGKRSVRIRDLSRSGVQIHCPQPPETGGDLVFIRGELCVAGRVAWTKANEAGIAFYRKLDADELGSAGVPPQKALGNAAGEELIIR